MTHDTDDLVCEGCGEWDQLWPVPGANPMLRACDRCEEHKWLLPRSLWEARWGAAACEDGQ